MAHFLKIAAALAAVAAVPIPSAPQRRWMKSGIMALTHFNMATFFQDGDPGCNPSNWPGPTGSSNPASFAPSNLNVSNWFDYYEAIGATEAVITAKHGCGFLLWPTKTTLPDGSPYHYNATVDIIGMFAAEAQKRGMGFGWYYSLTNNYYLNALHFEVQNSTLLPGQAKVTQSQYEALAEAQLMELWTNYGNLNEIWLDGGVPDQMQDRVTQMLNTYQPGAVAFNGLGVSSNPVRWCGTESGNPPGWPTIWMNTCGPGGGQGSGPGCASNSTGAVVNPSAVDFTLQQGDHWFFEPGLPLHSVSDLVNVYHNSVGSNAKLELDFAIDRTGNVAPNHAAVYSAFGAWIRSCYGMAAAVGQLAGNGTGAQQVTVTFGNNIVMDRIMMEEAIEFGQRVNGYTVEVQAANNQTWLPASSGITIGTKRIDLFGFTVNASAVRFSVVSAFDVPFVTIAAFEAAGCVVPSN